jgi:hypothetical protein
MVPSGGRALDRTLAGRERAGQISFLVVAEHHRAAHPPTGDEEIHLPPPTVAPAILGFGVTLLSFGILFGLALVIAGALFMTLGLAIWLINDARDFERAGEHGGHH